VHPSAGAIDISGKASRIDPVRMTRARIGLLILGFTFVFGVIGARLVQLAVFPDSHFVKRNAATDATAASRPDIFDRSGRLIATDVRAPSLFGEPRKIIDVDDAVEQLAAILPDLDTREMRERLSSKRGFVWLKREISPAQRLVIHRLGLPGIGFLSESRRVYPSGSEIAHVIGMYDETPGERGQLEFLIADIGKRRRTLLEKRRDLDEALAELAALEERCRSDLKLLKR